MSKIREKHDHATLKFPEGFLWGCTASAYQVEGNNYHADWWAWEQKQTPARRSGQSCDQYNRFESDFDLIKSFHQNAHRLSIEWSRIEPIEGQFDYHEIEHYKGVLKALKDRKIIIMLTLHHFTNPLWLAEKGGWENPKTPFYFERFLKTVVPELKEYIDFWVTINEPTIYIWHTYHNPKWPFYHHGTTRQIRAYLNLVSAHKKAYRLLHQLTPHIPVGIAHNTQSFDAYHKHSLREQLGVIGEDFLTNHLFYFLTKGHHDFLGINYYFHHRLNQADDLLPKEIRASSFTKDVSDLGWEVFPEGVFEVLTDMSNHLPIYITECGIATTNDDRRIRFLMQYLQEVNRAIKAGVKVKGFFYWSLLDNFEWADGFEPRFGLVEVDFKTQKRTPRPSAFIYADIIKHNGIRHELMKFLGHRVHADEVLEIPK